MVGRKVCVGVGMAVGPGDPEGLIVVDGILHTLQCQSFIRLGDTSK
jgi:hypothetical protein